MALLSTNADNEIVLDNEILHFKSKNNNKEKQSK